MSAADMVGTSQHTSARHVNSFSHVAKDERSARVIGRVLRAARERSRLTQQELALRADMDRAYVNEVENGKRSVSVDRMLRLCLAIGVATGTVMNRIERELRAER